MSVYQTNGLLQSRLYIYDNPEQLQMIFSPGKNQIGAGIRAYPTYLGRALSKGKWVSKILINGKYFYVNTHSMKKFGGRARRFIESDFKDIYEPSAVEALHEFYIEESSSSHYRNIRVHTNLDDSHYSRTYNIDGISFLRQNRISEY